MSLVVVRALGLVTVQDLGRPGRMHEGLAPGGALIPELLVAANRRARNPDGAAAIELLGQLVVRAERELVVATGDTTRRLAAGEELALASVRHRAAYLAVRGGLAVPVILGGRGTQLSAGIGALLRAGDRLALDTLAPVDATLAAFDRTGPIHLLPGPDLAAFAPDALAVLCSAPYRISPTSDRVGTRLDGPALARTPHGAEVSRPLVRGAIEVPRDGAPIVMGPEHPTTGGYPVLAVIAHTDVGKFFSIPLGSSVTFRA